MAHLCTHLFNKKTFKKIYFIYSSFSNSLKVPVIFKNESCNARAAKHNNFFEKINYTLSTALCGFSKFAKKS